MAFNKKKGGIKKMLKNILVILGCLGLVSTASAEVVRDGQKIDLVLANTNNSILMDSNGEKGYLMVTFKKAIDEIAPRVSEACAFAPAASHGSARNQYVKVNIRVSSFGRVEVQFLIGDGKKFPSLLACKYDISAQDFEDYKQDVFTIGYMNDKGYLPDEIFIFDIDVHQYMLDNSIAI